MYRGAVPQSDGQAAVDIDCYAVRRPVALVDHGERSPLGQFSLRSTPDTATRRSGGDAVCSSLSGL